MGLQKSWIFFGATTLRAQGHPGGDGGESDSSGGPRPERFIVVENNNLRFSNVLGVSWHDSNLAVVQHLLINPT